MQINSKIRNTNPYPIGYVSELQKNNNLNNPTQDTDNLGLSSAPNKDFFNKLMEFVKKLYSNSNSTSNDLNVQNNTKYNLASTQMPTFLNNLQLDETKKSTNTAFIPFTKEELLNNSILSTEQKKQLPDFLSRISTQLPSLFIDLANTDKFKLPEELLKKLKEANGGILPDLEELRKMIPNQGTSQAETDLTGFSLSDLVSYEDMDPDEQKKKAKVKELNIAQDQLTTSNRLEDLQKKLKSFQNKNEKGLAKFIDFDKLGLNKDDVISKAPLVCTLKKIFA